MAGSGLLTLLADPRRPNKRLIMNMYPCAQYRWQGLHLTWALSLLPDGMAFDHCCATPGK
jgi:hypothetical protein